jgi:hypothetical protein
MLRLLLFAPCEKVISSSEDNSGSLIAILQGFTLRAPLPSDTKEPVLLPVQWYIFSLWEYEHDDHRYMQKFELISPFGKVLADGESKVINPDQRDRRFQRNSGKSFGFPLEGSGDYKLRLLLKTDDEDFIEVATFPIPVIISATSEPFGTTIPVFRTT